MLGDGADQQVVRFVESVDAQADQKRTEVTLQEPAPEGGSSPAEIVSTALNPFIDSGHEYFREQSTWRAQWPTS